MSDQPRLHTGGSKSIGGLPDFIGDLRPQTITMVPCSFCGCYRGACRCTIVDFETSRDAILREGNK